MSNQDVTTGGGMPPNLPIDATAKKLGIERNPATASPFTYPGDPRPVITPRVKMHDAVRRAIRMASERHIEDGFGLIEDMTRWLQEAIGHEMDTNGRDDAKTWANAKASPAWMFKAAEAEMWRIREEKALA